MITTNDHIDPANGEPKKLGIRTTDKLTEGPPEAVTRKSDLSKVITTHDEPKMEAEAKKGKGKKGD
jgi:hypothetical protein